VIRVPVDIGIYTNGRYAEFPAGTSNADGNLPPVSNQDLFEHNSFNLKSQIPNTKHHSVNTQIFDLIIFTRIPERGNKTQIPIPSFGISVIGDYL
jgi:hypothetical protein